MSSGIATVTRKYQIAIPAAVAQSLGLQRGDKLALTVDRHGTIIATPVRTPVEQRAGSLTLARRRQR